MTDRPTDDATTMVVMKWKEWPDAHYRPKRPSNPNGIGSFWVNEDECEVYIKDPRDDTDAALELLGWVMMQLGNNTVMTLNGGWMLYDGSTNDNFWPLKTKALSGEAFRYAVVALAIAIFNKKENENDNTKKSSEESNQEKSD